MAVTNFEHKKAPQLFSAAGFFSLWGDGVMHQTKIGRKLARYCH
ncbi:MAG: hypothetical protein ACJA1T_001262 [Zhongshania aliphaticivorans]|jgi:hypothetical protein